MRGSAAAWVHQVYQVTAGGPVSASLSLESTGHIFMSVLIDCGVDLLTILCVSGQCAGI